MLRTKSAKLLRVREYIFISTHLRAPPLPINHQQHGRVLVHSCVSLLAVCETRVCVCVWLAGCEANSGANSVCQDPFDFSLFFFKRESVFVAWRQQCVGSHQRVKGCFLCESSHREAVCNFVLQGSESGWNIFRSWHNRCSSETG